MLLFCEWGVLWCPGNFVQDVEIFLHSLLAVRWLAAGDVHSEVRAGKGWAPAVNADSNKILQMLLASEGLFCCVQVNVTHLRRGPRWDWEGYRKAEIARVRWKRSGGLEMVNDWRKRKKLMSVKLEQGRWWLCSAAPCGDPGIKVSCLCWALWDIKDLVLNPSPKITYKDFLQVKFIFP